jgi:hypothetical protein
MPRSSIYAPPRKQVSRTATVPAPIGGLNARDSAAAMPVTDAIVMRNFFPLPYAVALRQGWIEHVTGLDTGINPTLATYNPQVGSSTLYAFTGSNIYHLVSSGPAPPPLVTGLSNDYWQTAMFVNAGGTYLYAVNGEDSPRVLAGGSSTTVIEQTPPTGFNIGSPDPPEAPVDPTKFIHVEVHQRRLWFVERDSMNAWFLPPNQIGGSASLFPVGQLFKRGGFLMAIYTWTVDSGQGMDDKLVFISSRGEIAIYAGTDPEDATKWSLEGVIHIGAPVGRRCGCKYGGDLLLLTTSGVLPLSVALLSTRVNNADNLTDKIQQTISAQVTTYGQLVGWEMLLFPDENQLWLVVPVPTAHEVYAMNTITGSWTLYSNMEISSSTLLNDRPYFITEDGRVCRAWQGYFDNVPLGSLVGDRIEAEVVTAYNYFGLLGQSKRWTMVRAIFQSGTVPAGALSIVTDYAIVGPLDVIVPATPAGDSLWDVATWYPDPTGPFGVWDTPYERYRLWRSVDGLGYAAALHLKLLQGIKTEWVATDFVFEPGGVL